jgi:hypothetical protein
MGISSNIRSVRRVMASINILKIVASQWLLLVPGQLRRFYPFGDVYLKRQIIRGVLLGAPGILVVVAMLALAATYYLIPTRKSGHDL